MSLMEKPIIAARVWQWTEGIQSQFKQKVECAANEFCIVPIFDFILISFRQLYIFFLLI